MTQIIIYDKQVIKQYIMISTICETDFYCLIINEKKCVSQRQLIM